MEEMFNMKNLADGFIADAEEFINKQKQYNNMNKQVKVTALAESGATIESGWFKELNKGEEYAREMTARGCVVFKQYR